MAIKQGSIVKYKNSTYTDDVEKHYKWMYGVITKYYTSRNNYVRWYFNYINSNDQKNKVLQKLVAEEPFFGFFLDLYPEREIIEIGNINAQLEITLDEPLDYSIHIIDQG